MTADDTTIVALDARAHGALRFDRHASVAARQFAAIGQSEIALAAAEMPLCFLKDAGTGRFNLVALAGLVAGRNALCRDGRVQATYLPRAMPLAAFRLGAAGGAGAAGEAGEAGLAIDLADPGIGSTGEALFDASGQPAAMVRQVAPALRALVADIARADAIARDYAARGLLRALSVVLVLAGGGERRLAGLYTPGIEALADLPDAAVVAMHRADRLAPAAVISASLAQFERLRQAANAQSADARGEGPKVAHIRLGLDE